jgi:hypothetical protein
MAVGLLPFVILTLTIERFHIILEEQGARQGRAPPPAAPLFAAAAYGIIRFDPLQTTFFVFPELLLTVMAVSNTCGPVHRLQNDGAAALQAAGEERCLQRRIGSFPGLGSSASTAGTATT